MEDKFYHLTVKGNDLKTYVRRFQELATLCPTMVPDSEKMMEVFIGGLPRSIKGNVTASKPQTLEQAINIAQRLMDQFCCQVKTLIAFWWVNESQAKNFFIVFLALPLELYFVRITSLNSDDIQAVGSDTRPPMLDRTDYESWSQRIRLYCRGKENRVYILQSIDQGWTNEYYVRFHKLVNDMRNIRMTIPSIQLNSMFVNNMSPEWDRFVTAVKLNKGLKETNHEQLYAYFKQHEKHVAQDRLIIERITPDTNDQLAFISTIQPHAQSSHVQSHQYPSSSTNP
ncbi:hypothetical protein Tco_0134640 [Tanacetum coccineum]